MLLQGIIKKHQDVAFPKPKVKIPDLFTPDFMKALQLETEANALAKGAVKRAEELLFEHIEENTRTEDHQLDEIWQKGINEGFQQGKQAVSGPVHNQGFLRGVLRGWEDAETFKASHLLFDTNKTSTTPIAVGKTELEFAKNVPDTKENRLWRATTMEGKKPTESARSLTSWQKANVAPFTQHVEMNRLSLNLPAFMKEGNEVKGGLEGYVQETSGNTVSKAKKAEKQTKVEVLAKAMGKNVTVLDSPAVVPERPEPTLRKLARQVEQQPETPEAKVQLKRVKKPVKALTVTQLKIDD